MNLIIRARPSTDLGSAVMPSVREWEGGEKTFRYVIIVEIRLFVVIRLKGAKYHTPGQDRTGQGSSKSDRVSCNRVILGSEDKYMVSDVFR